MGNLHWEIQRLFSSFFNKSFWNKKEYKNMRRGRESEKVQVGINFQIYFWSRFKFTLKPEISGVRSFIAWVEKLLHALIRRIQKDLWNSSHVIGLINFCCSLRFNSSPTHIFSSQQWQKNFPRRVIEKRKRRKKKLIIYVLSFDVFLLWSENVPSLNLISRREAEDCRKVQ